MLTDNDIATLNQRACEVGQHIAWDLTFAVGSWPLTSAASATAATSGICHA